MDVVRENAGLARDFHPWVEGKRLPMDLFYENGAHLALRACFRAYGGNRLPIDLFR